MLKDSNGVALGYHKKNLGICTAFNHIQTLLEQIGRVTLFRYVECLYTRNINKFIQITIGALHFQRNREMELILLFLRFGKVFGGMVLHEIFWMKLTKSADLRHYGIHGCLLRYYTSCWNILQQFVACRYI